MICCDPFSHCDWHSLGNFCCTLLSISYLLVTEALEWLKKQTWQCHTFIWHLFPLERLPIKVFLGDFFHSALPLPSPQAYGTAVYLSPDLRLRKKPLRRREIWPYKWSRECWNTTRIPRWIVSRWALQWTTTLRACCKFPNWSQSIGNNNV